MDYVTPDIGDYPNPCYANPSIDRISRGATPEMYTSVKAVRLAPIRYTSLRGHQSRTLEHP